MNNQFQRTQLQEEWTPEGKKNFLSFNMGPQHPATHGVLRIALETDGEFILSAEPELGYLHRCMEKHSENLEYRGVQPFVDRLDYLSAMNQEYAYILAVEKLFELEVPYQANIHRLIVCELQRIASHLIAFGTFCLDLGAPTPFLLALSLREHLLDIFEHLTGARLLYNYLTVGGVSNELDETALQKIGDFKKIFAKKWTEISKLTTEGKIFQGRTRDIGILDLKTCLDYGVTGPALRASGVAHDLRKKESIGCYKDFDFKIVCLDQNKNRGGDCFDRHFVRMEEMRVSLDLVSQAVERLEKGMIQAKIPKVLRPPPGSVYSQYECPRGELGFYITSDGSKRPSRVKVRSPGLAHLSLIPTIAPGMLLADFVAFVGSLDFVLGEVDR